MEKEGVLCRFCLTTDDGEGFEPLSEEILKKVADMSISIADATGVICRKCNADIEAVCAIRDRILDAQDYFEDVNRKQQTKTKPAAKSKIVYECASCLATFKNIESLKVHIAEHDLELGSKPVESELSSSFLQ